VLTAGASTAPGWIYPAGVTDILSSFSDDRGLTWTIPSCEPINSPARGPLQSVACRRSVTGDVNLSFYDTRNDPTSSRFMTDTFFTQSVDGGVTFAPQCARKLGGSNEHDCNGVFPSPN